MSTEIALSLQMLRKSMKSLSVLMSCYLVSSDEVFCQPHWKQSNAETFQITRQLGEPKTGDTAGINNTAFVFAVAGGCASLLFLLYVFGGPCIFYPVKYFCRIIGQWWAKVEKCGATCYQQFFSQGSEETLPVLSQQDNFEPHHVVNMPHCSVVENTKHESSKCLVDQMV